LSDFVLADKEWLGERHFPTRTLAFFKPRPEFLDFKTGLVQITSAHPKGARRKLNEDNSRVCDLPEVSGVQGRELQRNGTQCADQ
jgi:hypothetical protein